MKNNRLYPLLALLLLMGVPTKQNNRENTLGKKGIPFWGKKVYLLGVKTYTFFWGKEKSTENENNNDFNADAAGGDGQGKTRQKTIPARGALKNPGGFTPKYQGILP